MQNYGQTTAVANDVETRFNALQRSLGEINSETSSLIYNIEEKLHQILNLRSPQKEGTVGAEVPMSDWLNGMQSLLNDADTNRARLSKIYQHICQLV